MNKTLFIVAGESSGDSRAAEVIRELNIIDPSLRFTGLGGQKMASCGVSILYDLPSIAVVGLTDVLKKYPLFKRIFNQALTHIKETRPQAVILVDYPGFNLRLAKKVAALNIPVIYYISPQIWAWASGRVKLIEKIVKKMLVILPFEVDFYKKRSTLDVEFVGHPLVGSFSPSAAPNILRSQFQLTHATPLIAMLPGSREHEVKRILPITAAAAELLSGDYPQAHFLISKAPDLPESLYHMILKEAHFPYTLTAQSMHDVIAAADFCWVTSGTATLETTLGLKPYIILYKSTWLTYTIAKHLVKIPHLGLANIIAGKEIVPEFLQKDAHPETIAHETKFMLSNTEARAHMINELRAVVEKLGTPGAAQRAAQSIARFLSSLS